MSRNTLSLVRRAALPLALGFATLFAAAPTSAQEIDLTGEWIFTVSSPNGTGTRQVVFEQDGNDLSGTVSSTMAAGPLSGMIDQDDGTVTFSVALQMDSGAFDVVYLATWVDGELVDGLVDFGDYGEGTFTGVRKEGGEGH